MVRVFDCHSFKAKKVIPIQDEPLAICSDEKHVFVATRRCTVIVYAITEEGCKETRRFDTISLVEKLLYNTAKNYLITVEFKKSWKNLTKYIRVYLNWDTDTPQGSKIKTKVRIAGKSHSSLISSTQNYLDVVEIPVDRNISDVSICSQTGNFAIAVDREVKVFHLVDKTVPSSGKTYRDVEVFLELCYNFRVSTLALCEDCIICCAQNEFQAIRLQYTDSETSQKREQLPDGRRSDDRESLGHIYRTTPSPASSYRANSRLSSLADTDQVFESDPPITIEHVEYSTIGQNRSTNPSPYINIDLASQHSNLSTSSQITDDEYFQSWRFDGEDSETGEIIIHLQGLQGTSKSFSVSQKSSPPVLRDLRGGPFKSSGGVRAVMLLHFTDSDMREDWRQVLLLPSYLPGMSRKLDPGISSSPVTSPSYRNLASMCCLVSGSRGGCLYSLYPRVKLVSCYKYTTSAVRIIPSNGLLQVATKTGIETYTSREKTVAVHQVEEFDFNTKASPPTDLEICLIGIQPFIGATDIAMTTDHLILLTKVDDPHSDETVWGLYALQTCSQVDLYRDMVSFACKVMETGPSSYIHLVQEAHLHIKAQVMLSLTSQPLVEDHFLESCALLGEFYSLPDEEDWRLCLPYYVMSNLSLEDIIRQALQHKQHSKLGSPVSYGKGLLYYLNYVLFLDEDPIDIKESYGNEVLRIYTETEPEKLSHVILVSRLQTFSPEVAMELLTKWLDHVGQRDETSSDLDLLAMVKLDLLLVDLDAARTALAGIKEKSLILMCAVHPNLVHRDYTEFTPLAQLMRQHRPSTFLHLLVELFDRSVLTLDVTLKLLQNQAGEKMYNNSHIKEYLEILVSDTKRQYIFEEAVRLLSEIYIHRTIHGAPLISRQTHIPQHFQMPPAGSGHYAGRFLWLDSLSPFSGPQSMTRPCQHLSIQTGSGGSLPVRVVSRSDSDESRCPCCFCNEDLLKLQSLLCWEQTSQELCLGVCHQIQSEPDLPGWDSIWLLCTRLLDWKQATEFFIDRYPTLVPLFASSTYRTEIEKWQYCLRCVEAALKELPSSRHGEGEEGLVKTYRDILQELAELLAPDDFLNLLPTDGSFAFMLPYITHCFRQQQTNQLKAHIVQKGFVMIAKH